MRRLVGILWLTMLLVSTCGRGAGAGACTELREVLDPTSAVHLLDFSDVTWLTHPPTSGPHYSAPTPTGAVADPLDLATQVTILEGGGALIQYGPEVGEAAVATLATLAGDAIVVAPGAGLPAPIVATAWTWKLSCDTVDLDRIEQFARERVVDAPGHP